MQIQLFIFIKNWQLKILDFLVKLNQLKRLIKSLKQWQSYNKLSEHWYHHNVYFYVLFSRWTGLTGSPKYSFSNCSGIPSWHATNNVKVRKETHSTLTNGLASSITGLQKKETLPYSLYNGSSMLAHWYKSLLKRLRPVLESGGSQHIRYHSTFINQPWVNIPFDHAGWSCTQ